MTQIERIIEDSMDIWEGYLRHPFITGLADGTLDEEKFLRYLNIFPIIYMMIRIDVEALDVNRFLPAAPLRHCNLPLVPLFRNLVFHPGQICIQHTL